MKPKSSRFVIFLKIFIVTFIVYGSAAFFVFDQALTSQGRWNIDFGRGTAALPTSKPPIGQASIDEALRMFKIQIPPGTSYPKFSAKLEDRGLMEYSSTEPRRLVTIGPAAFQSWGLLGSTLAHELEVHARQSIVAINILDSIGLDGSDSAEREAYYYEMASAFRFRLREGEVLSIRETMDYFYRQNKAH